MVRDLELIGFSDGFVKFAIMASTRMVRPEARPGQVTPTYTVPGVGRAPPQTSNLKHEPLVESSLEEAKREAVNRGAVAGEKAVANKLVGTRAGPVLGRVAPFLSKATKFAPIAAGTAVYNAFQSPEYRRQQANVYSSSGTALGSLYNLAHSYMDLGSTFTSAGQLAADVAEPERLADIQRSPGGRYEGYTRRQAEESQSAEEAAGAGGHYRAIQTLGRDHPYSKVLMGQAPPQDQFGNPLTVQEIYDVVHQIEMSRQKQRLQAQGQGHLMPGHTRSGAPVKYYNTPR